MPLFVLLAVKEILRDRVSQGILATALIFLAIPVLSEFTMRQVNELAISLCLSLVSFVLLLLAIFLGGVSLWRDMERRYTYSVLGLPVSRTRYLLGKFFGISLFLLLIAFFLGLLTLGTIWFVWQGNPVHRPLAWGAIVGSIFFDTLKYILLVAVVQVFSAVSTSYFLPIFGAVAVFAVGGISQQVYDYLQTSGAALLTPAVVAAAKVFYWVVPNFSAFDLKPQAIYGLPLDGSLLLQTFFYWTTYLSLALILACWLFSRREML